VRQEREIICKSGGSKNGVFSFRAPGTEGCVAGTAATKRRFRARRVERYAECMMSRLRFPLALSLLVTLSPAWANAQDHDTAWTFAVSGDSRNCGDFVMPAIASKVKAENDTFYWHLGDFRWMTMPDQDMEAMETGRSLFHIAYQRHAWDDFLKHQMGAFGSFPVFLGRGNHENVYPMTRESYIAKFSNFLSRAEIAAQRKADGGGTGPLESWYHWTRDGVDFITLDNASREEFSDAQLDWLRAVLDRDLAPHSGIRTIVAGMHEALPHSTGLKHAMDDWDRGVRTGEQVYAWFFEAQSAGKHVYLIASHSHYYAPNVFATPYWTQQGKVIPGWIIGLAGAHRYNLPAGTDKASETNVYGYMQGTVHADGTVDFALHKLSENDLIQSKWPNAPLDAIHECVIHNRDESK
jgi:hypothetical protein